MHPVTLTRAALAPMLEEPADTPRVRTAHPHTTHRRSDHTRSDTARADTIGKRHARHVKRGTPATRAGRNRRTDLDA